MEGGGNSSAIWSDDKNPKKIDNVTNEIMEGVKNAKFLIAKPVIITLEDGMLSQMSQIINVYDAYEKSTSDNLDRRFQEFTHLLLPS